MAIDATAGCGVLKKKERLVSTVGVQDQDLEP